MEHSISEYKLDNSDNRRQAQKLLEEIKKKRKRKKFQMVSVGNKTWIEKEIPKKNDPLNDRNQRAKAKAPAI